MKLLGRYGLFQRLVEDVRWKWICFAYGVGNLNDFFWAVWHFNTCSYDDLIRLIEIATRKMRDHHRNHGVTVDRDKMDKQLTIVSTLCRRIWDDKYFENAGYNPKTWHLLTDHRQTHIVKHAASMEKQDVEYLSKMFRGLRRWWD